MTKDENKASIEEIILAFQELNDGLDVGKQIEFEHWLNEITKNNNNKIK